MLDGARSLVCSEMLARLDCLRGYALNASTEAELQDKIARVLTDERILYEREKVLDRENRVDFYLPAWSAAVEVKISGSPAEVFRQLQRYAALDAVDRVVLVTRRSRLVSLPREVNGKPLHVIALWRGGL